MKAKVVNGELVFFKAKEGVIGDIDLYSEKLGYKDFIAPELTPNQKVGVVIETDETITYEVVDKTGEEITESIEARKQELLLKLVAAIVEVNSIKEAAREIVGSDNEDFINSVAQAEAIRAGSIYLIGQLDTLESAMAFDVREHTVQAMKELFIKFIIQ